MLYIIYPSDVSIYTSTMHPMGYFQTPRILKAGVFDESQMSVACGQYFLDEHGKRTNEYT